VVVLIDHVLRGHTPMLVGRYAVVIAVVRNGATRPGEAPTFEEGEGALRDAGFLTNAVAPDVLRLAPPLVLTDAQVDALVAALPAALDTALETTP
jgi:acetylornithine/succinyldiaminopimelate/putrescine aminotransferase